MEIELHRTDTHYEWLVQDGLRPVDLANMLGFSDMVIHLTNIDTKAQVDKIKQYQQWL